MIRLPWQAKAALAMVPVAVLVDTGSLLLMTRHRQSPQVLFVIEILALRVSLEPARLLALALMVSAVQRDLRESITGTPWPSRIPRWFQPMWGIHVAQVLGVLTTGFVVALIERSLGESSPSLFMATVSFLGSVAVSYALARLFMLGAHRLSVVAFRVAAANQMRRLAALYLDEVDGETAYARTEQAVMILTSIASLVIPLSVVFVASETYSVVFAIALLVTIVPLILFLRQRKNLPTILILELQQLFIPLQLILGANLIALLVFGYALMYVARFSVGAALGVTIPFAIPRVFDGVFALKPFAPAFGPLIESVVLATAFAVLSTWAVAVVMKRAWANLALGLTAGLAVFFFPYIIEAAKLPELLGAHLTWTRPFILSALLPMVASGVADRVRERWFPYERMCLACLYERMTVHDAFCPRCGVLHPEAGITLDEASERARRRRARAVMALTDVDVLKLEAVVGRLRSRPGGSALEEKHAESYVAQRTDAEIVTEFNALSVDGAEMRPAHCQALCRRLAEMLRRHNVGRWDVELDEE